MDSNPDLREPSLISQRLCILQISYSSYLCVRVQFPYLCIETRRLNLSHEGSLGCSLEVLLSEGWCYILLCYPCSQIVIVKISDKLIAAQDIPWFKNINMCRIEASSALGRQYAKIFSGQY